MEISELEEKTKEIRIEVIKIISKAGSGHPAGSLGMADIFTNLYFHSLKHDPKQPLWNDRDRVILSAGHIVPVQYVALAKSGYFPEEELKLLRRIDSKLQGHPKRGSVAGIENTSGPLGQGVSVAVGIALAGKMNDQDFKVICISSDGEMQEGQTWEALMFAAAKKLDNLIIIIDKNNIQLSGPVDQIMPIEPLTEKLQYFNFQVFEIDGHNHTEISDAVENTRTSSGNPVAVIANTTAGRGVDFMENSAAWHGKAPNQEEAEKALRQLSLSN